MVGFVFWVVGIALAIVVGFISHMTPVLYHLCVFFQRHIVFVIERSTGRSLSIGGLVFASLLVWGGLGALVGGLFLVPSLGIWGLVVPGTITAAWGGSVGYQVGMQNLVFTYRQPGVLPDHHPGNIRQGSVSSGAARHEAAPDEWLHEGTVLGEAIEYDDSVHH